MWTKYDDLDYAAACSLFNQTKRGEDGYNEEQKDGHDWTGLNGAECRELGPVVVYTYKSGDIAVLSNVWDVLEERLKANELIEGTVSALFADTGVAGFVAMTSQPVEYQRLPLGNSIFKHTEFMRYYGPEELRKEAEHVFAYGILLDEPMDRNNL